MAKQIKSYIAKLQEIQPSPGTDLAYWNWRCQYIGMEGVLMLMKSEHKNPGELFLKMLSSDGRYLKTSYGTVECTFVTASLKTLKLIAVPTLSQL